MPKTDHKPDKLCLQCGCLVLTNSFTFDADLPMLSLTRTSNLACPMKLLVRGATESASCTAMLLKAKMIFVK